ncbi:hypothetical protein F909_03916 [Acinetobacter sp. ANC 3929]|uniref:hypothetical protein n=1 Tax=Acinetobacter sp. ANC 3929 TaxID=1217707 RepID=UPI0002CF3051|nr:hypothetical protein [Acinetobacter sp. ANC 3929]ENW78230.1 hypothetical protein F909_03916 [Acinetobacter sp. ANC 3929]
MGKYNKTEVLQFILIFILIIFSIYNVNTINELSDSIDSLNAQIESIESNGGGSDLVNKVSDLEEKVEAQGSLISEQEDKIAVIDTRLGNAENDIDEAKDKIDSLCLHKNICL